jgi:hypothetical protein
MSTRLRPHLIALFALLISRSACAFQLDYSVEAAWEYTDNVNESALDPIAQSILIPRVNFDLREDGADIQARAIGQIEGRDYLGGAFDKEVREQLAGIATWTILPQRLSFDFEDYAAVQPVNLFATNAPGNQQQTNVATLGPTLQFRLPGALNAEADLRFTNSAASKTAEFDSDRVLGALRATRSLSPLSALSANIVYQRVHFTDPSGGPDYNRADTFVRYRHNSSDIDFDLSIGNSRLNYADASDQSALLAHGEVTWRASPHNTLAVGFARQISDAAQDMVVDPAALVAPPFGSAMAVGSLPITSQAYLQQRAYMDYVWHAVRFQLHANPYYEKLDYAIDASLDQKVHGVVAGFSYRPRPLWTLAFDATQETRDYVFVQRRDEERRYDLSFVDRLTHHWSLRVDLMRNLRHSTVLDQGFCENLFFLTLIFRR